MTNLAASFPQTYRIQLNFHFDETQRLLELARALPEDVYRATSDYSHASIHNTFTHLVGAAHVWRHVLAATAPSFPDASEMASIAALAALFEIERRAWLELIATLDTAALLSVIERQTPFGTLSLTVWQTIQHVILHGMTHHTELARMLTAAGQAPGDIDFLLYQEAA